MKWTLAIICATAAGCGLQLRDPCADVAGTCLAIHVDPSADVADVDELTVTAAASGTPARSTRVGDGQDMVLPVAIAVIFDSPPASDLSVRVAALRAGAPFVSDPLAVDVVAGQHATVHATLHAIGIGGNGEVDDAGDGAPPPDMAQPADQCIPMTSCPTTIGCGLADDGCGGHMQCTGTCELTAISPALANSGASVTLEGTFGADATVTFPGAARQPAMVLGAHRARVVVPPDATAGDLIVTTGGTTVGPLPFHRAPYALDLQPFRTSYDQAGGGHFMDGVTRVSGATAIVGPYVYFIGGSSNRTTNDPPVARATINPDGTIESVTQLTVPLSVVRRGHSAVVIGDSIYVIGGAASSTGSVLDSVERATASPDGTLSPFAVVPNVTLHTARSLQTTEIIGDHVYVIGGFNGGPLADVERAAILPDGTLSTFESVPGVKLQTPRRLHTSFVRGDRLYVVGGWSDQRLASVESASILADGTLGPFATVDGVTLTTARSAHRSIVVGDSVYVIAGDDAAGKHLTSIERATFSGDTLSTFQPAAFSLATERSEPVVFVASGHVFVTGGLSNSGWFSFTERASLDASGALGNFAVLPDVTLATPRALHVALAAGRYVYVIGGGQGNEPTASIEAATVAPDGSLSTFAPVAGITLATPRMAPALLVSGGKVYVLGGTDAADNTLNTVEEATLAPDGSFASTFSAVDGGTLVTGRYGATTFTVSGGGEFVLGGANGPNGVSTIEGGYLPQAFQTATATLPSGASYETSIILGSNVYGIGGDTTSAGSPAEVYGAVFGTMGLSSFAPTTSMLVTGRYAHGAVVLGSSVYVLGGRNGTGAIGSVERAPVAVDGTLGAFATATATLNEARSHFATVIVGDSVYVIGGIGVANQAITSVERVRRQ